MRWIDIIRIAARMVQTNVLRAFLTVLGIGVAVGLIVFLIGLGYGIQEIAVGSILRSKNLLSIDITAPTEKSIPFNSDSVARIQEIANVKEITPVIISGGEATIKGKVAAVTLTAAEPNYLELEGISVNSGRVYTSEKTEAVVSAQTLDLLGVSNSEALGSELSLQFPDPNNQNTSKKISSLKIVGISENSETPGMYIPFSLIKSDKPVALTSIKAAAFDPKSVTDAQVALVAKGYQVETLYETLNQARGVFKWVTFGLGTFGLIAILVASIGMFNTLTIALLERTKEFGIMKAIGVDDTTIRRLFLTEAGIIGFGGGLTGLGLALGSESFVGAVLNRLADKYGGNHFDLFQHPTGFLLGMMIFPIVLGVATGLYPAIRASRLNPLKALRYE